MSTKLPCHHVELSELVIVDYETKPAFDWTKVELIMPGDWTARVLSVDDVKTDKHLLREVNKYMFIYNTCLPAVLDFTKYTIKLGLFVETGFVFLFKSLFDNKIPKEND
jgi:hypothetical protein